FSPSVKFSLKKVQFTSNTANFTNFSQLLLTLSIKNCMG
ncbi:unnamed protein product, partial [Allacma fusca]